MTMREVFGDSSELVRNCRDVPGGEAWLASVPELIDRSVERWSLRIEGDVRLAQGTASVVLAVRCPDDTPAVLKLGLPHMEATHEAQGLRFWDGTPTVRLLAPDEADEADDVMLLERCHPGTPLSTLPEEEQDEIIASLLRELWRSPGAEEPTPAPTVDLDAFRPLSEMLAYWGDEVRQRTVKRSNATTHDETTGDSALPAPADIDPGLLDTARIEPAPLGSAINDPALLDTALSLFEELPRTAAHTVLLATDLHAGNVLRAERRPWLVIDPKPFLGDPAYDVTQHLLNCGERMAADPLGLVSRIAALAGLDAGRVRLWMFARAATTSPESHRLWRDVARSLAP
ncbi:MAG: aminoglycoside phosphotransferase family protein [Candidatus Eisenbacteria bacterium]